MKILLFGKNGQIGWELQRSLSPLGKLIALGSGQDALCGDLSDLNGIAATISAVDPDVIVNAAAYTQVDRAESDREKAQLINARAPEIMARCAEKCGAWFVHYSTDYVFDGSGTSPWQEGDKTNPLNIYGKTKRDGEEAIMASKCRHLIFRTSWVYAARKNNFLKTILRLAKERDSLSIIHDQKGAPTGADLIADVTGYALRNLRQNPDVSGLYHLVSAGETSWHDYAHFILSFAQQHNVDLRVFPDTLTLITSEQFPTPAKRPLNSRLDTTKLRETFQLNLPDWKTGVAHSLAEILGI